MLTFALDGSNLLTTSQCVKSRDYRCPECLGLVRLRGGSFTQEHFYHYMGSLCRWSQVGLEHRACQRHLLACFQHNGMIECSFPSIQRIADFYLPSQALVVEVQYSPISPQEVIQRILDYQKIGLQVIWVLDKNRFLHHLWDVGDPLNHLPHYFLDMELLLKENNRLVLEDYLGDFPKSFTPHNIWRKDFLEDSLQTYEAYDLKWLAWQRKQRWKLGFQGDWLSDSSKNR